MLKVNKTYAVYTNHETLVGEKVKVIGILTYDEALKVPYDIKVLALSERVISMADEDLISAIGDDNIYWLRAINPNVDGTYPEFLVWDSIINLNKTTVLGESYSAQSTIYLSSTTDTSVNQVIAQIQQFVQTTFSGSVNITFNEPSVNASVSADSDKLDDETIETLKNVVNTINGWDTKLIPAAEKIMSAKLSDTINDISQQLNAIQSAIALARRGL